MPRPDETEPSGGQVRRVRENQENMQLRLHIHHVAVSPLANKERLFNTQTNKTKSLKSFAAVN